MLHPNKVCVEEGIQVLGLNDGWSAHPPLGICPLGIEGHMLRGHQCPQKVCGGECSSLAKTEEGDAAMERAS